MWRCRWRCRWRRTRAWPQRWRQWTAPDLHGRQRGRLGQAVDKLLHRCAPVRGRGILEGLPGALLGRAHVAAEVEVALRGGRLLGVEGLEVLLSHVLLSHVQLLLLVRQRGSDGEDVITRARVASRQVAAAERGRRAEGMRPKAHHGQRHHGGPSRAKRLIGPQCSSGSSSSSARFTIPNGPRDGQTATRPGSGGCRTADCRRHRGLSHPQRGRLRVAGDTARRTGPSMAGPRTSRGLRVDLACRERDVRPVRAPQRGLRPREHCLGSIA